LAGLDVESGIQASGAAALVVAGAGLRMASLGRQRALRHLPRLDLGLDVDRDHHGVLGRVGEQPDDVEGLFDEARVTRHLVGLHQVKLDAVAGEYPVYRAAPQLHAPSQLAGGPEAREVDSIASCFNRIRMMHNQRIQR